MKRKTRFKLPKITPDELRDTVNWLWSREAGCYHKKLWTDDIGREWDLVIGWHDYGAPYEGDEKRYYVQEKTWYITFGFRYQTQNNVMQTDMDVDFMIPWFKDTGDCYDMYGSVTRCTSYKDWRKMASAINADAKTFRGEWWRNRRMFG